MSTILDALKKLQREKAAQSPSRDLRGSVANETSYGAPRRRSGLGRALVALAVLALVGGGGWWAYSSGQVTQLVARFAGPGDGDDTVPASEAELDALEREVAAAEAEVAAQAPPPRAVAIPNPPPAAVQETPEMTAERARLEAVIAQAREAQQAQQRAETAPPAPPAPAPAPAVEPPPPAPAAVTPPPPPAPAPAVAKAEPKPAPPAPKQAAAKQRKPIEKPKPAAKPRPPTPEPAIDDAPSSVTFPAVSVDSIRWHPIPERRVASLRFEQQNAPEAHEGDIVSGVLVFRIDPGAVELRIGDAQRIVRPGS